MSISVRIALAIYLVVAILFAMWSDAMDRRFGVRHSDTAPLLQSLWVGAMWPLTLPIALTTLVCCDGRWRIAPMALSSHERGGAS